jgi:hypothetical protein
VGQVKRDLQEEKGKKKKDLLSGQNSIHTSAMALVRGLLSSHCPILVWTKEPVQEDVNLMTPSEGESPTWICVQPPRQQVIPDFSLAVQPKSEAAN